MDADLRRPTVHHQYGLNSKFGLSTLLTGAATLEQAVQRIPEVPNLDVLVSGPMPPFPTEMLSSETMNRLLEHASEIYTHIVIDSPPVLSVTDAVILARHADAVVMVIRHGKSSKHVVRRARDLLLRSGAPLTGILLNAVDVNSPDYYGYYGYSGYSNAGADAETWQAKVDTQSTQDSGEGNR
jgi:capsular exopolysaccharide synthesis family protein